MTKAVVVGSGFGGIASALRLKAKGYDVTLIERGDQLGGRARVFKQDGYQFDAGPTVITAPYLLHELFELFGKDPHQYIKLKRLDHWYQYRFADGRRFDYVADESQLFKNIAQFNPKDVEGFKKLLSLAERIFAKGFTELSDKPFFTMGSIFKHAPALMKLGFYNSVYKTVAHHMKDPSLRQVFTTQPLLVGGDPFKTTSIYLLILHLERLHGCHFSYGGTHGLISALETLMNEVGITIIKECTATKFIANGRKIQGVETDSHGTLSADLVVYNGDPAYAHHHLMDKSMRKDWPNVRLKTLKYSMSMCLYYFGTDKKYEDIPLHTIIYGDTYKPLLNDIFHKQKLNLDLSLYLYRPTAIDSTLAPPHGDSFYVLAPVPNLLSGTDWSQEQAKVKERILDILDKRAMPGIRDHIATEKMLNPHYFQQDLLSQHGSAFSIQPIFSQSAYFRFHNRAKHLKGLYFAGAGTHPGAGVPGVLSSAKLIDNIIPACQ